MQITFTKTDADTWTHAKSGVRVERMGDGRYRVITPSPWRSLDSRSRSFPKLEQARWLGRNHAMNILMDREAGHASAVRDDYYRSWGKASEAAKASEYGSNAQEAASRGDFDRARAWLEAAMEDAPADEPTLEVLDAQMDQLRVEYASINDRLKALNEQRTKAVDARLAELSDEEIMADEKLIRWVLRESWAHSGAHKRKNELARTGISALYPEGSDARDEYAAAVLPCLTVRLEKDQDVTEVAAALRTWAATWALGRTDFYVDVFERTLSEHGSYGAMYDVEADTLKLTVVRYGHRSDLAEGPAEKVLAKIAKDHWYCKPGGERADWDDEDDDY